MILTRLKTASAVFVFCGLAAHAEAADGILIVRTTTSPSGVSTTQSQMTKTKMRTDIAGTPGQSQVVIFDGDRQVLDMVNWPTRRTGK